MNPPAASPGPAFPLRHRLARAAWNLCWLLLFRPSPRPLHAWRSWLLAIWGARMGRRCHVYPGVVVWAPWNFICDDDAGVGDGVIIYNQATIHLGRRCVVSQGTHLCSGTHDYTDPAFPLIARPITVGDLAWVAAECFVHPGVTIGEGAVIGARSVVTKDQPAWMVCAGHPCLPRKPRPRPAA